MSATGPKRIELPKPVIPAVEFGGVLMQRRSVRSYLDEPLTDEEVSALFWAAQGISDDEGRRTAPSAGAHYPVEVYAADRQQVVHYLPADHAIEVMATGDRRRSLSSASLDQALVADAPFVMVLSAVLARTAVEYGDRAWRYLNLEAGHVAQNVLLAAVALGLGSVPVGAFEDESVQEALSLPALHRPLYVIPVGRPAKRGR